MNAIICLMYFDGEGEALLHAPLVYQRQKMSANTNDGDDDDLFKALKPMRVMYSLVGCTYISHLKRHKRKSGKGEKLFGVATKVLALVALVVSLWGLPRCTRRQKTITAATRFITGYMDVIITGCNLLFAFVNRKTLICTLAKFITVDLQLRKIKKTNTKRRVALALTICAILQLLKLLMDGLAVAAGFLRLFCMCVHMLRYTSTLIIECYLVLLLLELKVRFRILNNHIAGIIDASHQKTTVAPITRFRMIVSNGTSDSFVKSGKLHSDLCDIGKLINRSFEGHILIINFASFMHVVSSFFYLIEVVDKRHYFKDLRNYFYILYWLLTYAAETFAMFYAFTSVTAEAKKTASILHSRRSINAKIKHSDLMVIFTKQLYFQNAKFSVYQLYPIDWTALFFILCNVFTFLIILLQFNSIINSDEV